MGYMINPFQTSYAAQRKDNTYQLPNVSMWHVGVRTYGASGIVPHPLQLLGAIPHTPPGMSMVSPAGSGAVVGGNLQGANSFFSSRGRVFGNSPRGVRGPRIAY